MMLETVVSLKKARWGFCLRFNKLSILILKVSLLLVGCSAEIKDPSFVTNGNGSLKPGPVVQLYSVQNKEYIKGGSSYPFQFKVTDTLGFNANRLEYSRDNGATWDLMVSSTGQSAEVFPTLSGQIATFNWAVPTEPNCAATTLVSDSTQYKFRITSTGRQDSYPTTVGTSVLATVDSCAPKLTAGQFQITGHDKGFINFTINGIQDAQTLSPVKAVCIKRNTTAPGDTDSCWRSLSALRVAQTATPSTINLKYFAGFTAFTSNYSLWVMDMAKNITTNVSDTTDFIASYNRTCGGSACALSITQAMTANSNTTGSALVTKTGDPTFSGGGIPVLDPGYFVVTSQGHLIYRDATTHTIKRINLLTDTSASTLIAYNAAPVDGDQTAARVTNPARIALDFDENLYILDQNRIRKVVFTSDSQFTVSTIVGSGGDSLSGSLANPLDLQITSYDKAAVNGANLYWYGTFNVLQSGKIYFSSTNPQQALDAALPNYSSLKLFDPAGLEYKVTTQTFSGPGVYGDNAKETKNLVPYSNFGFMLDSLNQAVSYVTTRLCESVGTCSIHDSSVFDITNGLSLGPSGHLPNPSQWSNGYYFNSRQGDLYHITPATGEIKKANRNSLIWNVVAGNGANGPGFCADATNAQSCSIRLWDSYVGNNDLVYFIDEGRLRFVDLDGKVKTLTHE